MPPRVKTPSDRRPDSDDAAGGAGRGAATGHPRSTWRAQQAAVTRDRIADAARRLFASRGYGSTSIDSIAAEAGVAVRTVYATFGNKREILSHICGAWLDRAGAREAAREVLAEPDTKKRLERAAHWLTHLYAAGFDVVEILESATDDSPETRELLRAKLAGRDHVMDEMIASLAPDLTVPLAEAQAMFRGLAAPPLYRELVVVGGWSPDRLANWMADVLHVHLLGR